MTSHESTEQMTPDGAVRELAAAASALVTGHDVIGVVTQLLAGCTRAVGARSAGIVVAQPGQDQLEFLAATTHRAQDLELYQLQVDEGPGIDSISAGTPVTVSGTRQIAARWPKLAAAFRTAGYTGVHAAPMKWQDLTIGAVNLFFAEGARAGKADVVSQAFADIAVVAIVHADRLELTQVVTQLRAALSQRAVIERAKGVIAYTDGVPMEDAFDKLLALAQLDGATLTAVAAQVVDSAVHNRRPG